MEKTSKREAVFALEGMGATIVEDMDWLGLAYSHPELGGRVGVICYYDHLRDSVLEAELMSHLEPLWKHAYPED